MAGLDAGAAVELAEQVADVHVDGPLADEQLLGDLAVGAADGDVAQDLKLAAGQLDAVLGGGGGAAAEPLGDRLAEGGDFLRRLGGERPRSQLGRSAVGVAEPLQSLLALAGGGEVDAGAQFHLRPLVRDRQVAVQLDCAREAVAPPAGPPLRRPTSRASSPTACASAATASSWPPSVAIWPSAAAHCWASLRRPWRANQLAAQRTPQTA